MAVIEIDPTSKLVVAKERALAAIENIIDPDPSLVGEPVPSPTAFDRPHPDGEDVREMDLHEVEQVARTLAEAFEPDDPHFAYVMRDEDKRLQQLGSGILSFLQHDWLPNGIVYTNNQLSGAAVWTHPGKWQASIPQQARIFKSLIGVTSPVEVMRFMNLLGFVEGKHKEIEQFIGPHYYLAMIGIAPQWQGKGWGDALLKPMLERCDEENATAYLESSTERSVPLYERNGFEVIAKGHYRGARHPLHFMRRKPRP